jgi:hypothetical protein
MRMFRAGAPSGMSGPAPEWGIGRVSWRDGPARPKTTTALE